MSSENGKLVYECEDSLEVTFKFPNGFVLVVELWVILQDINLIETRWEDQKRHIDGDFYEEVRLMLMRKYHTGDVSRRAATMLHDFAGQAFEEQKKRDETTSESPTGSDSTPEDGTPSASKSSSTDSSSVTQSENSDSPTSATTRQRGSTTPSSRQPDRRKKRQAKRVSTPKG